MTTSVSSYGVLQRNEASNSKELAIELVKLLGYAVIDSGLTIDEINSIRDTFDVVYSKYVGEYNQKYNLSNMNEESIIRLIMKYDPIFLSLASNPIVLEICQALIGDYIILNQQNGVINPPNKSYSQGSYHRDLPYQHFTSSKPLAINALYCVDDFTLENGGTYVIPGSHKEANFPSDLVIAASRKQIEAAAGSFILLDCMAYHSGAPNKSMQQRRAVNHVYTIPLIRQQISIPHALDGSITLSSVEKRLLGYDVVTPASVEEYFLQGSARRASTKT